MSSTQNQHEELQERYDRLLTLYSTQNEEMNNYARQIKRLKGNIDPTRYNLELEKKYERATRRIEQMIDEEEILRGKLEEQQNSFILLQEEKDSLDELLKDMKKGERELLMTVSQLQASQQQLKEQIHLLQTKAKNSPESIEERAALQHTILRQRSEYNSLRDQTISLHHEIRTSTLKIKRLEKDNESLQKKIQQIEEKDILEDHSDASTTTTNPQDTIEYLREKCVNLQDLIQQMKESASTQPRTCSYCLNPNHISILCPKFKTTLERVSIINEFSL